LTLLEVMVVVALLFALVIATMMFTSSFGRSYGRGHGHNMMHNSSKLRGLHQSAVIFSQSNGYYLPGLDSSGKILPNGPQTGFSGPGSAVASRFWILLDGQYIPPEILANPRESLSAVWARGAVVPANYSYAALQIQSTNTDAGRLAEWKDNANSNVVLFSDRNIGKSGADRDVRSLWTSSAGDWEGNMVWGDNHAEYSRTHTGLKTRYLASSNTNDNIFLDESGSMGSNTLMVR